MMTPKQELIKKLYDDNHISFEEMLLLLEAKQEFTYIPFYPYQFGDTNIYPSWWEADSPFKVSDLVFENGTVN